MAANNLLPKDIKAIKAKYPDTPLLKPDFSKVKKNKNAQQPTYYIPIGILGLDGKYKSPTIKFVRQLMTSSAKISHGVSEEEARDLRVSFRQISKEDLEGTDYPESSHESLLGSNKEFCDALNIIADAYIACVEKDVLTYKGKQITFTKNKTINCFRQSERKAGDGEDGEDGMIKLETPIFRIKITADPNTKKLGYNSEKTGHVYTVYDSKRASREMKEKGLKVAKPVIARIKTKDGYQDLTISNAKHFITYMSLVGGTIYFDSICISKSGISLMCRFKELHVWGHKPMKNPAMNDDDMADMAAFGTSSAEAEDDIVDLDEPDESGGGNKFNESSKRKQQAKKPTSKGNASKSLAKALDDDGDGETALDDDGDDAEPDAADVDDPDELVDNSLKSKPKSNPKTAKGVKAGSTKPNEPPKVENKVTKKKASEEDDTNAEPDADGDDTAKPAEGNDGDDVTTEPDDDTNATAKLDGDDTDTNEETPKDAPKETKPAKKSSAANTKSAAAVKPNTGGNMKAGARKKA